MNILRRIIMSVVLLATTLQLVASTPASAQEREVFWDKDNALEFTHSAAGKTKDDVTGLRESGYYVRDDSLGATTMLSFSTPQSVEAYAFARSRFLARDTGANLHVTADWWATMTNAINLSASTKFTVDLRVEEIEDRRIPPLVIGGIELVPERWVPTPVSTLMETRLESDGSGGGLKAISVLKIEDDIRRSYDLELEVGHYYWVEFEVRCRTQVDILSISAVWCDGTQNGRGLNVTRLELEYDTGQCDAGDTRDGCVLPEVPKQRGDCGSDGYWLIETDGDTYDFGDADDHGRPAAGVDAVDIESSPTGCGYWSLTADGTITSHGDAANLPAIDDVTMETVRATAERFAAMSPTPSGRGMWIFTDLGRVITVGDAQRFSSPGGLTDLVDIDLNGPIVDSVATPDGDGYYMLGSDGGVFAFGRATFEGSIQSIVNNIAPGMTANDWLSAPIVGLVPDPDGTGYWLVGADGGVFTFEASFRGSTPGILGGARLDAPITGMVPYGDGYLQVAEDGGVFNFSNKPFLGSLGGTPPNTAITAISPMLRPASTPDTTTDIVIVEDIITLDPDIKVGIGSPAL